VLESGCSSLAPRHSPYYRADDRLSATDASVWLAVEDDGICFDITAARGTGPRNLRYTTLAVVMQLGAGGRARLVLPEWDTGRPVSTPAAPTIPCRKSRAWPGDFARSPRRAAISAKTRTSVADNVDFSTVAAPPAFPRSRSLRRGDRG
jgi:hypothetical protein